MVGEAFLAAHSINAGIGETVQMDTESFHGAYIATGILKGEGKSGYVIIQSIFRIFVNNKKQSYG